jgi:hypothetical protein
MRTVLVDERTKLVPDSSGALLDNLYVAWLQRQGVPLFKNQSHYWRRYGRGLIPATVAPTFLSLDLQQCKSLLRESRAWLLRYSSDPSEDETPWWYIVCDSVDPKKLSPKIRQNLKRAGRQCSVRKIDAEWLADEGYSCYRVAYERYTNATPTTEAQFRKAILATVEGPFEHWGVFVESKLVGYCQCIVEGTHVNTSVTKYDPSYLKVRTAYALVSEMVNYYVVQLGMDRQQPKSANRT